MNPEESAHTIFNNALELPDLAARARYVNDVCAGDAALGGRVEKLLLAHGEAGGFFSRPLQAAPAPAPASPGDLPVTEKAGDTIGRYKLLEQIGEGGCGVVYMAEQMEPVRRRVALKVIKLGMDTKQVVARFEAERQALALMDHPNIAKVLDAGATASGRPFFVMELVRGRKMTEFCDEKKLPTDERLKLFISVCHAVQHAHQKGIIHRDLKPSNILVTTIDGEPVPKVIDFGIAKATSNQPLTDKTLFTAFEQFIGTPAYMSPEQAEMSGEDIDTRTDTYSLGVVLYELLTGKTPFDAEALLRSGLDEIRRTIRDEEPKKPSNRLHGLTQPDLTTAAQARHTDGHKLIQTVRGDLDWIVMKCLEKDRSRRYGTANGLARDVERHLNCEPVAARPPGWWYEFQKTVRRHKIGFAATAAVILALAVGLGISTWTLAKERETRKRAEAAEQESRQQLCSALLEQARATLRSGELGQRVRALDALRRAAAIANAAGISNSAELRREVLAALALPDLRFERDLPVGDAIRARLDPAFERFAAFRGPGPVEVHSVSDNRVLVSLPASTDRPAHSGRWSSDGRFLAVHRDENSDGHRQTVEVWDVPHPDAEGKDHRETRDAREDESAATAHTGTRRADAQPVLVVPDVRWHAVSFHPHLPRVMAGRQGGIATIQDLAEKREVARFKLVPEVIDLGFSPDGERFAALCLSGRNATVSVHDAMTGTVIASNQFSDFNLRAVMAWHPHGAWIAIVDGQGTAYLMDSHSGEKRTLGQHKAQAVTAVFSPDGGYLFTGSWENELICWDTRTMRRAFNIALNAYSLQFDSDGNRCAVYVPGGPVKLHAFERPGPREFSEDLGPRLLHATFSPDGRWLGAAADKRGGVWDLSGASPAVLDEEARGAQFFFTPDGREVFGSRKKDSDSTHCFRWQLPQATNAGKAPELTRLPLWKPSGFKFMTWFSNSVVMTGEKGSQVLAPAEYETGAEHWIPTAAGINGVSADGQWLAIYAHFSPALSVYRLPGLESVAKLTHPANVYRFDFSPRGDELAVSSRWGVEFWNTSTWQRTRAVTGFRDIIYTPDAGRWWLTKDAFTAGLYDAPTVEPLLLLPNGMLPLALSADGRHLAVSVDERRLQVWDLAAVRQQLRELGLDWDDKPARLTPGK